MATIVQQAYTDFNALRLNGTNQDAWKRNPSFKDATVGTFAMWVRFPAVLASNGSIQVRTFGNASANEYMQFGITRQSTGDAPVNTLSIVRNYGGVIKTKAGSTTVVANTWSLIGRDSDGDLWLNGAKETAKYWGVAYGDPTRQYNSGWYNELPGTTKDMSFGTTRLNGGFGAYYNYDLNDTYEFNAVLTSTEWAELYAAGMGADPYTLSSGLQGKIINVIDFENRATPFIGSDGLTLAGSPLPSYITP